MVCAYFLSGCFSRISDLQPVAEVNAEKSFLQLCLAPLSDPSKIPNKFKDTRNTNQCKRHLKARDRCCIQLDQGG